MVLGGGGTFQWLNTCHCDVMFSLIANTKGLMVQGTLGPTGCRNIPVFPVCSPQSQQVSDKPRLTHGLLQSDWMMRSRVTTYLYAAC